MTDRTLLHVHVKTGKVDVIQCDSEIIRQTEAVKRKPQMETGDILLAVDNNPAGETEAEMLVVNNPMPVRAVSMRRRVEPEDAGFSHDPNDPTLKPGRRFDMTNPGVRRVSMEPITNA